MQGTQQGQRPRGRDPGDQCEAWPSKLKGLERAEAAPSSCGVFKFPTEELGANLHTVGSHWRFLSRGVLWPKQCFGKMNLVMMFQQTWRAGRAFSSLSSLVLCPSNPPSSLLSYCCFLPTLCREAPPELPTRSLCPPHGCSRSGEPAPTTPRLLRSQPGPPPSTPMTSSSSRPSLAATCGMGRCVQVSQLLKAAWVRTGASGQIGPVYWLPSSL